LKKRTKKLLFFASAGIKVFLLLFLQKKKNFPVSVRYEAQAARGKRLTKKRFLGADRIFPKFGQRAPGLADGRAIAPLRIGLTAQCLHMREGFGECHKPEARRRPAALMQGVEASFGTVGKHLGRGGQSPHPGGEDIHQLVQARLAYGRGNRGDPCRVDRI